MEINLIDAIFYSVLPTVFASLITLYVTERVKGKVKNNFDKKIEEVRKEHSIEISKFQSDLNSIKEKENYKFTKLHEKRFEILEKLYHLINITLKQLNSYIAPVKSAPKDIKFEKYEDDLQANFINAHQNFVEYFSNNKIYLNDNIVELIEKYLNEVSEIYLDYSENHLLKRMGERPDIKTNMKAYTAYKRIPEKIHPIRSEIEKEFRDILEK